MVYISKQVALTALLIGPTIAAPVTQREAAPVQEDGHDGHASRDTKTRQNTNIGQGAATQLRPGQRTQRAPVAAPNSLVRNRRQSNPSGNSSPSYPYAPRPGTGRPEDLESPKASQAGDLSTHRSKTRRQRDTYEHMSASNFLETRDPDPEPEPINVGKAISTIKKFKHPLKWALNAAGTIGSIASFIPNRPAAPPPAPKPAGVGAPKRRSLLDDDYADAEARETDLEARAGEFTMGKAALYGIKALVGGASLGALVAPLFKPKPKPKPEAPAPGGVKRRDVMGGDEDALFKRYLEILDRGYDELGGEALFDQEFAEDNELLYRGEEGEDLDTRALFGPDTIGSLIKVAKYAVPALAGAGGIALGVGAGLKARSDFDLGAGGLYERRSRTQGGGKLDELD